MEHDTWWNISPVSDNSQARVISTDVTRQDGQDGHYCETRQQHSLVTMAIYLICQISEAEQASAT